jgi:surfeit locus 1 family protein
MATQGGQSVLKAQDLVDPKIVMTAVHRRASLEGSWRPEHTIFLDNRQMNQKPGFIVVTPLVLSDTGQVILVQRGWAPRNFGDRMVLPEVLTPPGRVAVDGRIAPPPSKLYEFKGAESGRIRQNIDLSVFSREIALPLLSISLVQMGSANEGLLREWAAPNVGIDKHYGYAFQWFALCALVVGLYFWFQFINPWRSKRKTILNV